MNTKIVAQAIDETLQELLAMPTKDFKNLLKENSSHLKKILLDGGFISCFGESTSKEELLKGFPDLVRNFTPSPSKYRRPCDNTEHYLNKHTLNASLDSDFTSPVGTEQVFLDMTTILEHGDTTIFKTTQPHKDASEIEIWIEPTMQEAA